MRALATFSGEPAPLLFLVLFLVFHGVRVSDGGRDGKSASHSGVASSIQSRCGESWSNRGRRVRLLPELPHGSKIHPGVLTTIAR